MPLLNLVVTLMVVGVALYLINRYIPMGSSIKTILNVVVVFVVCVWLLQAVGWWGNVGGFQLTR
jgi:predicted membrane protein